MQSSLGREIWTGVLQRRGGECAPWTLQAHLRALEGLAFNSPRLGRAELGTRRPVPPVPGSPRGPHGAPPGRGCRRLLSQHHHGLGFSAPIDPAAAVGRRPWQGCYQKSAPPEGCPRDWVTEGEKAPRGKKSGDGWGGGSLPRCFADYLRRYGSQIKYLFTKEPVNIAANTLGHFGCGAYDYFRS